MEITKVAKVCHEVNRAYCKATGMPELPAWDEAPQWMRDSAIQGVRAMVESKATTPEQLHQKWVEYKVKEGWVWGPKKDPEKKTHPSLLPYDALLPAEKVKDYLFAAVVNSML